jgi:hypothetical protein
MIICDNEVNFEAKQENLAATKEEEKEKEEKREEEEARDSEREQE